MANSAWQAWIEVLPDMSKFKDKAHAAITPALGQAGTFGAATFGKTFLSGVGQVFGGAALAQLAFGAGRAIGDAISSAVNFGLDGIQLASSLTEQANAVKVAFGPVSAEILALAEKAPQKLNLTRAAFDKLSVRFSSFAKTIAGSGGNVSKVIDDLTTRGADFASVYDLDVNEALELFQSGLAGETEPLRKFGVDLSEASVKAFAYANGIAETGKQLTEQEKIQARYLYLLQQTDMVTGDLANTSGSLANQQRQLAVGIEEAQTQLGEALLPTMTSIVSYANTTLIPRFKEVIDVVGPKIAAALELAGPAFEKVAEKAGPLLDKLITMGTEALPGVLDGFNEMVEAAPEWIAAFEWANDPNAQPAKFLNDLTANLQGASDAIREFFGDTNGNGLFDDIFSLPGHDEVVVEAGDAGAAVSAAYIQAANEGLAKGGVTAEMKATMDRAIAAGFVVVDKGGKYLATTFTTGFNNGITGGQGASAAAGRALADAAVKAAKLRLQSNSPSKVMEGLGDDTVDGYINPLEDRRPDVEKAMQNLIAIPTVPTVNSPTSLASSEARPSFIDPAQMRELIAAFKVELLTDDVVLATSTGRGAGFQTALGTS